MTREQPSASLSVDLDNQWSYMKTHGDPNWETFPSYFDLVVPRILAYLEKRNLQITFFIVGQDAAMNRNHAALESVVEAGHEIGNHSFHHEPWLDRYSENEIEDDIIRAEEHIETVTGKKPVGFRGPGYTCNRKIIRALIRQGYLYDASILPTFIGPLARAYYFLNSKLNYDEKNMRSGLFGSIKDGLRPNRPYLWHTVDGSLIEIPVTTVPILRIPFHASYVLYISGYSRHLALSYFRTALLMCRLIGIQPSLLLHPLDFLDASEIPELSFFPGNGITPLQENCGLSMKSSQCICHCIG